MRRFFVPEVVQTSSLDCGPAALKAMLEGFGIHASYGRIREACQTGLDGTSIDTLELIANQLGLEAEQIMLPRDHLLLPEANAFPAIIVVTLPQGLTHFVVVWRRIGQWLQIMDPAVGRRWVHSKAFLSDVYQHTIPVGAHDWTEFASSEDCQRVFKARQKRLGIQLVHQSSDSWKAIAAQDAAVRLINALLIVGAIPKGKAARQLVQQFAAKPDLIPAEYWSVTEGALDDEGNRQLLMRGAVLLRAKSKRTGDISQLDAELAAVVTEKPVIAGRELFRVLYKSVRFIWPLLLISLITAASGAFIEALLFRGLLDVNGTLALAGQRMAAVLQALIFCGALLCLELPAFVTGARLGRILENRFRVAFLEKLPKLSDRYFQSRPISDMAERSHIIHRLRHLPDQLRQLARALLQLTVTAAGIVWLEPGAWPFMLGSLAAALIPLLGVRLLLAERDLRVRTHSGGLMRFYLDAMLGLMPVRTHGAAANLRRQHSNLLSEWMAASFGLQRAIVLAEALQLSIMFALVAALLLLHPFLNGQAGRVLLLAYWALNMPALGQEIATLARQYPNYRSIALRLLEPLGASEEEFVPVADLQTPPAIEFQQIGVVVSGNIVLSDVSVSIQSGSHVAIIGPSGAGKSSLIGLLLGWLKPASGTVLIDGQPLNVEQVRRATAWVDPGVQLWNRSLQSNLSYGATAEMNFAEVIDSAALRQVLENLPNGFQTPLGENGGLISGGEGQRVRFARALQRPGAKLVILDEPFRGLDHEKRRELLERARSYWAASTLICVTHDIAETRSFDQVLVIERGVLIENGSPDQLMANLESRYSQLLASEEKARKRFWGSKEWRRICLQSGKIVEEIPKPQSVELRESEVA